jgi:hypothetical protein
MQFVPSQDSEKIFSQTLKSFLKSDKIVSVDEYWKIVDSSIVLLRSLPFVSEIAVCNNLAFGLVTDKSDIDLLVVLKSERFFMARFLITLILHIKGLRRYGNKIEKRFCLSFFVADNESCLNFKAILIENDVYFYYLFKNLVFLKNNFDLQKIIIELNRKNFSLTDDFSFKNYDVKVDLSKSRKLFRSLEFILNLKCLNWLEKFLGFMQLKKANWNYKRHKYPFGVVIKNGTLKFHLSDIRIDFRNAYLSRFK